MFARGDDRMTPAVFVLSIDHEPERFSLTTLFPIYVYKFACSFDRCERCEDLFCFDPRKRRDNGVSLVNLIAQHVLNAAEVVS